MEDYIKHLNEEEEEGGEETQNIMQIEEISTSCKTPKTSETPNNVEHNESTKLVKRE